MKHNNKLLFGAAIATVLSLGACTAKHEHEVGVANLPGEAVATVNGVKIVQLQVEDYINYRNTTGHPAVEPLEELINMELLRQAAIKAKLEQRDIVKAAVARASSDALANALVQAKLSEEISDAKLKIEYDKQVKEINDNKSDFEYNSSHILLEKRQQAEDIIEQLNKGGDFSKLAIENSVGPSAPNGGALGWAGSQTYVKEFAAALKELEVGKFTQQPVKTQFGYHVVKLLDKRAAQPVEIPEFEMIKSRLKQMVQQRDMIDFIGELRKNAKIDIADAVADAKQEADEQQQQLEKAVDELEEQAEREIEQASDEMDEQATQEIEQATDELEKAQQE